MFDERQRDSKRGKGARKRREKKRAGKDRGTEGVTTIETERNVPLGPGFPLGPLFSVTHSRPDRDRRGTEESGCTSSLIREGSSGTLTLVG